MSDLSTNICFDALSVLNGTTVQLVENGKTHRSRPLRTRANESVFFLRAHVKGSRTESSPQFSRNPLRVAIGVGSLREGLENGITFPDDLPVCVCVG